MNRFTSQLFAPFRALGLITGDVPFLLERRGTENFVTLACEKSFQVLNVSFTHTHTHTHTHALMLLFSRLCVFLGDVA